MAVCGQQGAAMAGHVGAAGASARGVHRTLHPEHRPALHPNTEAEAGGWSSDASQGRHGVVRGGMLPPPPGPL